MLNFVDIIISQQLRNKFFLFIPLSLDSTPLELYLYWHQTSRFMNSCKVQINYKKFNSGSTAERLMVCLTTIDTISTTLTVPCSTIFLQLHEKNAIADNFGKKRQCWKPALSLFPAIAFTTCDNLSQLDYS